MPADSNSEFTALRRQLFIQLLALVILAGSLTMCLYRQASLEGKQITHAMRVINIYNQNETNIVGFLNDLVAYGQKHPDFSRAVLKKYGIATGAGTAAASNSSAATTPKSN